MDHDKYWEGVCERAHERLDHLFEGSGMTVDGIVGDENGVDSFHDAKEVLAHALCHADDSLEKACAILTVSEIVHAMHELSEHRTT